MARLQCRACGFDGHATWSGELACPRCGDGTSVRAALLAEELSEAELSQIAGCQVEADDAPED